MATPQIHTWHSRIRSAVKPQCRGLKVHTVIFDEHLSDVTVVPLFRQRRLTDKR